MKIKTKIISHSKRVSINLLLFSVLGLKGQNIMLLMLIKNRLVMKFLSIYILGRKINISASI